MWNQKTLKTMVVVLTAANIMTLPLTFSTLAEVGVGGGVTQDRYGATATCSGGKIPLEESSVRQLLDANARTDEQQGHTVYAGTYVIQPLRLIACPDQFCEREETTKWSCRELKCRGQDADYVNTKHWRNKIIWKCSNGSQYVWCDGWRPKYGSCCSRENEVPCDGGEPGQVLCERGGVPSQR